MCVLADDEFKKEPSLRSRRKAWFWLINGVALVFSIFIALVLTEIGVRVIGLELPWHPMGEKAIVLYYKDPNGQIRLTPNWEGYVSGVWTKINQDGFRDRGYSKQPAPGIIRIAILGDSYTMGDGVELNKTYPKQLESFLSESGPVEVMNFGISASNTEQQLETLREITERYRPQLVVVGYNLNDFAYPTKTRFERAAQAGYHYKIGKDGVATLIPREFTPFGRFKMAIRRNSYLYRLLARLWAGKDNVGGIEQVAVEQVPWWIKNGGDRKSFMALNKMNQHCAANGMEIVVAILPALLDVSASVETIDDYPYKAEHEMIKKAMQERGIEVVDLLHAFAWYPLNDLVVNRMDRHYNDNGNSLIAVALGNYLKEKVADLRRQHKMSSIHSFHASER